MCGAVGCTGKYHTVSIGVVRCGSGRSGPRHAFPGYHLPLAGADLVRVEPLNSARPLLEDLGRLLHNNLPSLQTLDLRCEYSAVCTFSDLIVFLDAIQDTKLCLLNLGLRFPFNDPELCPTRFLDSMRGSTNLWRFTTAPYVIREEHDYTHPVLLLKETTTLAGCLGILAMNHAGRCYILADRWNKAKGIQVLACAADNLACLFLHLRENSFLCASSAATHRPGKAQSRG